MLAKSHYDKDGYLGHDPPTHTVTEGPLTPERPHALVFGFGGASSSNRFCGKFHWFCYVEFLCGDGQHVVLYKYQNE
jgi:hypothetical protein